MYVCMYVLVCMNVCDEHDVRDVCTYICRYMYVHVVRSPILRWMHTSLLLTDNTSSLHISGFGANVWCEGSSSQSSMKASLLSLVAVSMALSARLVKSLQDFWKISADIPLGLDLSLNADIIATPATG